jgi:hypothetical protein
MAAWPINPFFAKASEEPPLELGLLYCSDPGCEYCKELKAAMKAALEHMNRANARC